MLLSASNDQFQILQHGRGKLKSLVVPSLSSSFAWTAGTVAGSSKSPIYILAQTNDIPSTGEDTDSDELPEAKFSLKGKTAVE